MSTYIPTIGRLCVDLHVDYISTYMSGEFRVSALEGEATDVETTARVDDVSVKC